MIIFDHLHCKKEFKDFPWDEIIKNDSGMLLWELFHARQISIILLIVTRSQDDNNQTKFRRVTILLEVVLHQEIFILMFIAHNIRTVIFSQFNLFRS